MLNKVTNKKVSKMLTECRQTGNRFYQKISADWHQLHPHSAYVLSIKPAHIIGLQQIGSKTEVEPADRSWRQIGSRNQVDSAV